MKKKTHLSPLNIPEGKAGDFAIVHQHVPAGQPVMLGNWRTAIFGQKQPRQNIVYDAPTRWHKLQEGGGTWMSDLPIEQVQCDRAVRGMKGTVLVGGLGLGYAATVLARKKQVTAVFVVEISPEVIELVAPHIKHKKIVVVQQDLFAFLKEYDGGPFTNAFYDIWQSDGEGTFFNVVCPLYDLSVGKVKNLPVCWNECVMRSQLLHSLLSRKLFLDHPETFPVNGTKPVLWEEDGTDKPWWNWQVPFWKWFKECKQGEALFQVMAQHYTKIYGLPGWKEKWAEGISFT